MGFQTNTTACCCCCTCCCTGLSWCSRKLASLHLNSEKGLHWQCSVCHFHCTFVFSRNVSMQNGKTEYKSVTVADDATAEEFMDFYLDDSTRHTWVSSNPYCLFDHKWCMHCWSSLTLAYRCQACTQLQWASLLLSYECGFDPLDNAGSCADMQVFLVVIL